MKRRLTILLALLLLLSGCGSQGASSQPEPPGESGTSSSAPDQPEEAPASPGDGAAEPMDPEALLASLPEEFSFASGAGAWSTQLYLLPDGSFTGDYHDSDMGDSGTGYPNGTQYICSFRGTFSMPEQVDAYTYSMTLESIQTDGTPGQEAYEDGVRYIYSEPYGLENAGEVLIYLPGAPVAQLPQGFLNWTGAHVGLEGMPEQLPFYGLYNVNDEEGFVGYPREG